MQEKRKKKAKQTAQSVSVPPEPVTAPKQAPPKPQPVVRVPKPSPPKPSLKEKEPLKPKSTTTSRAEIEALKRFVDRVRKKENRCPGLDKVRRRKLLTSKLHNLLQSTDGEYDGMMKELNGNSIAIKIFYYIKEFDLFVRLLFARMQRNWSSESQPLSSQSNAKEQSILCNSGMSEKKEKDPMFAWRFVSQVKSNTKKMDEFLGVIKQHHKTVEDFYLVSII